MTRVENVVFKIIVAEKHNRFSQQTLWENAMSQLDKRNRLNQSQFSQIDTFPLSFIHQPKPQFSLIRSWFLFLAFGFAIALRHFLSASLSTLRIKLEIARQEHTEVDKLVSDLNCSRTMNKIDYIVIIQHNIRVTPPDRFNVMKKCLQYINICTCTVHMAGF